MTALAFASNDTEFTNEDSYTYANSPTEAQHIAAINQLRRMFPDVPHETLGNDEISVLTLRRAINHLTHADQKFDLSATFDGDHFEKMKAEAIAWKAWQESDDDEVPELLKYKPVSLVLDGDEEEEDTIIVNTAEDGTTTETVVERKPKAPRSAANGSKFQLALAVYKEHIAANVPRSATLATFEKELGIAGPTANVYYSKFKHAK